MATKIEKETEEMMTEGLAVEEKVNEEKIQTAKPKRTARDIEKDELKKENLELRKSLSDMQNQINTLMQIISNGQRQPKIEEDNEEVEVGCREFSGVSWARADGATMSFRCGEKVYLTVSELKEYFKDTLRNNKGLFSNGILYFYDESNYERFKITPKVNLSEENVIDIISDEDTQSMLRKVKELTTDLRNVPVAHTFIYMIADLFIRKPKNMSGFSYANREALEKYIGNKFEEIMARGQMYKFVEVGR